MVWLPYSLKQESEGIRGIEFPLALLMFYIFSGWGDSKRTEWKRDSKSAHRTDMTTSGKPVSYFTAPFLGRWGPGDGGRGPLLGPDLGPIYITATIITPRPVNFPSLADGIEDRFQAKWGPAPPLQKQEPD